MKRSFCIFCTHFLLAPVEGLFSKPKYRAIFCICISLLLYFLSSLRRGDQSTIFRIVKKKNWIARPYIVSRLRVQSVSFETAVIVNSKVC